jgi:hypothetical protein
VGPINIVELVDDTPWGHRQPLGNGVIGSTADSGSVSWGSSPCSPVYSKPSVYRGLCPFLGILLLPLCPARASPHTKGYQHPPSLTILHNTSRSDRRRHPASSRDRRRNVKAPHFALALIVIVCLCTGCQMVESFVAAEADRAGRRHSTDPDAQAQWDHDARYNGYGPSASKRP